MSPLPTILCKACGYVNEGARIYCHGCGAKLDREALLAQEQQKAPSEREKLRRVQKIMKPRGGILSQTGRTIGKAILMAALAAAIIDIIRPPEGAISVSKKEEVADVSQMEIALEKLTTTPSIRPRTFDENEVNAYLKREKFKKLPTWLTNAIPLRAYVKFDERIGHVGVIATVAGYPIYAGVSGEVRVDKNTGVAATCRGGNIGRLQIPAPVAAYAEHLVPMLLDSIQNQQQLLRQLKSVQINNGEIILESKGPSSLPPAAPPKASPVSAPVR